MEVGGPSTTRPTHRQVFLEDTSRVILNTVRAESPEDILNPLTRP